MLCCFAFATPWAVAHQAPLSMEIAQARILEWVAMTSSRGSSQPKDQIQVSHIAGGFLPSEAPGNDLEILLLSRFLSFLYSLFSIHVHYILKRNMENISNKHKDTSH